MVNRTVSVELRVVLHRAFLPVPRSAVYGIAQPLATAVAALTPCTVFLHCCDMRWATVCPVLILPGYAVSPRTVLSGVARAEVVGGRPRLLRVVPHQAVSSVDWYSSRQGPRNGDTPQTRTRNRRCRMQPNRTPNRMVCSGTGNRTPICSGVCSGNRRRTDGDSVRRRCYCTLSRGGSVHVPGPGVRNS